ncbi:MAG TPA: nucleotidyltransferase family protein [Caulobacteraceae bacterium]|nr:nucleotidyltransferase family protein [Caulobacteraceae bacterium]
MSGPKTAMVLAAGLGTRLRPLTDARPKALVEVAGKPLIDHALDRLAAAGVEHAVVNVHAFADQLEAHLAGRTHPSVAISDERGEVLETGGGLKKAIPLLGESPVWVSNIDTVALGGGAKALEALAQAWRPYAMDVMLLLAPTATSLGFHDSGDVFLEDDGRVRFKAAGETAPYLYVGVHIARTEIVADGPDGPFGLLEIWKALAAEGRLFGHAPDGLWMHVSDPAGKALVEARLSA